ncbi:Uncharacterized protein TCM_010211 [Theobroma cacao]|uniref:Uncharacterized protein n=1 Tax=Theobroma cacao TaxID=3641 RepID=A0A061E7M3_THECC|nr:Uncharacterized protein TCM_010211 [Theobroma cacao]
MAVDDYEAKFNRLSKFVIYLAFDYESRARRFENDLNAHICKALAPLHLASYDELVGRGEILRFCMEGDFGDNVGFS